MYTRTVVSVSSHYKNTSKYVGLVQSEPHRHLIEQLTFSRHDIAEKNAEFAFNNNSSLTRVITRLVIKSK